MTGSRAAARGTPGFLNRSIFNVQNTHISLKLIVKLPQAGLSPGLRSEWAATAPNRIDLTGSFKERKQAVDH